MTNPKISELINAFASRSRSGNDIAEALAQFGEEAFQPLLDTLENPDEKSSLRYFAAYALGTLGDARAINVLILALSDELLGFGASEGLSRLGKVALPLVLDALVNGDSSTRRFAAYSLRLFGAKGHLDETAVEPLLLTLDRTDHKTAYSEAITALGYTKSERAIDPLIHIVETRLNNLQDEPGSYNYDTAHLNCAAAAHSLVRIDSERAKVYLLSVLNDKEHLARAHVEYALRFNAKR